MNGARAQSVCYLQYMAVARQTAAAAQNDSPLWSGSALKPVWATWKRPAWNHQYQFRCVLYVEYFHRCTLPSDSPLLWRHVFSTVNNTETALRLQWRGLCKTISWYSRKTLAEERCCKTQVQYMKHRSYITVSCASYYCNCRANSMKKRLKWSYCTIIWSSLSFIWGFLSLPLERDSWIATCLYLLYLPQAAETLKRTADLQHHTARCVLGSMEVLAPKQRAVRQRGEAVELISYCICCVTWRLWSFYTEGWWLVFWQCVRLWCQRRCSLFHARLASPLKHWRKTCMYNNSSW